MSDLIIGKERRYYKEVDSTNTKAKEWAREGAKDGSLVLADRQTSGKGRNGRIWDSPPGVGIWMSTILRPSLNPQDVPQLSLIAGVAICKAIQQCTGLDAKIKWPNDVVVEGKKVCGILCEMQVIQERVKYAIVGIGINVNTEIFPQDLPHASSLYLLSGKKQDREEMITCLCQYFDSYYKSYEETACLTFLMEEYKSNCITLNNKVKILDNKESYEAYASDISQEGHLILRLPDGSKKEVFAGEVSVRGLYGYI